MITASKVSLAMICGWWSRDDAVAAPRAASAAALLGAHVHDAIEATIGGRPMPPLTAKERRFYEAWLVGWWREQASREWRFEAAYAVNPSTGEGRRLTLTAKRDYPKLPGFICGTIDAIRFDNGFAEIDDFKTGEHAPSVYRNGQLYTLALAVARAHDADISRVRVHITSVRPEGVTRRSHRLDSHDLDEWQEKLAEVEARRANAEPIAGPHCSALYCPSLGVCPVTRGVSDSGFINMGDA